MSIQLELSKYQPSQTYILAVLDLHQAKIEEICTSITTVANVESRFQWYLKIIEREFAKMKRVEI